MKQTTIKITCDTCDKDISPHETASPQIYILEVKNINIAKSCGITHAVIIYPHTQKDLHFCGLACMKGYLK